MKKIKKKKSGTKIERHIIDLYLGGERDSESKIIPKKYGFFFSRKKMLLTLIVLVILLLIAELK